MVVISHLITHLSFSSIVNGPHLRRIRRRWGEEEAYLKQLKKKMAEQLVDQVAQHLAQQFTQELEQKQLDQKMEQKELDQSARRHFN